MGTDYRDTLDLSPLTPEEKAKVEEMFPGIYSKPALPPPPAIEETFKRLRKLCRGVNDGPKLPRKVLEALIEEKTGYHFKPSGEVRESSSSAP